MRISLLTVSLATGSVQLHGFANERAPIAWHMSLLVGQRKRGRSIGKTSTTANHRAGVPTKLLPAALSPVPGIEAKQKPTV
jgi:hypothetical protein